MRIEKITESPIEADMLGALMAISEGGTLVSNSSNETVAKKARDRSTMVFIAPQAIVGKFRADFLVARGDVVVAVECDGAAYHVATIKQIENDFRRDDYFRAKGVDVMRFSGKRIRRDVYACAHEVLSRVLRVDTRDAGVEGFGFALAKVLDNAGRRF